jgi:hypothetical protein
MLPCSALWTNSVPQVLQSLINLIEVDDRRLICPLSPANKLLLSTVRPTHRNSMAALRHELQLPATDMAHDSYISYEAFEDLDSKMKQLRKQLRELAGACIPSFDQDFDDGTVQGMPGVSLIWKVSRPAPACVVRAQHLLWFRDQALPAWRATSISRR